MKQPTREFLRAMWVVKCPECYEHLGLYAWDQKAEALGAAERHQCLVPSHWEEVDLGR